MTIEGLATSPEQSVVTAGAQQGIDLLTMLLVRPGEVVLAEQTSWPGLADMVKRAGGRVIGVPMDEHGVLVDELAAHVERFRPAFIGLNPHHHKIGSAHVLNSSH